MAYQMDEALVERLILDGQTVHEVDNNTQLTELVAALDNLSGTEIDQLMVAIGKEALDVAGRVASIKKAGVAHGSSVPSVCLVECNSTQGFSLVHEVEWAASKADGNLVVTGRNCWSRKDEPIERTALDRKCLLKMLSVDDRLSHLAAHLDKERRRNLIRD